MVPTVELGESPHGILYIRRMRTGSNIRELDVAQRIEAGAG
jgi:hypothetical protein